MLIQVSALFKDGTSILGPPRFAASGQVVSPSRFLQENPRGNIHPFDSDIQT